ncbi:centrosomal protein of 295 kDa isoform X2 [Sebastes umbrosus]|uniref:centrosomal protein of 295 kDa isoform X2 n=1 Tax=Sebastes umbrosus TaxID=72105 RepID=UPI00189EC137|nr:centrosomal protein of 295 kDa isoform X2 [Sebastes umbrosus]
MKRKVAKLRLSPNEEARIIREEHERRRKLRIQQVREQQRHIAMHIRREVERRRQRELEQLEEELREDWEQQQRDKLHTLQRLYEESLQLLGQGHRSAKENEPDLAAIAQREVENHVKAEERFREALKELKSQRLKDYERQSRSVHARKKALQAEKERSAKVASLPPPLPNPIQSIDSKKPHVVKKSDVSAFAATHYHMPESAVDREADTEQPNAHEGAELEGRRLQDVQREEKRRREEQLEKARLRGKEALRREHLVQDRERLLVELEHMQQTDLLRRRQQVSQMPPQIFQPLYKRQESREDYQREMEFAFEDMYTGERRVKGDLVVQLVPEPLPALSTSSQDQELDVTLDENATQEKGNAHHDTEQEAGSTEQETEVEPSRAAPRQALKKLLDRIRTQRNQWTDHNSCVPAADSPTAISGQIPERDSTIDTGSLTSEEKEPAHSPPALETTKQPASANPRLPDVLANRIKDFEEERKKREQELDREKQQQLVLLQELEEQKAKLEQMLLEAQQEREDLKAAVTQRVLVNQPQVPLHDQEVTSVPPVTELVRPAGEDDHTRRIKEYQQRLLEQNRIHQRSVEVARQRLEEYQRALRIRHNMTSGLIHPHLRGAPSVHLPAPLQLPTAPGVSAYIHAKPQTPVEVPTREFDMLASSSRLPGSSASVGSKLLPDESISSDPRNQRPDVTAWLTDNIMERVTEHLPERVRPSSEPLPYKLFTTHHSASIPLQPTSDPIQAVSPSITYGAPLVPGHAEVKRGSLRTGSLSSREDDDMERQRRELQEVQRRVLQQREAAAVLQQQREALALQQQREAVALQQQREAVALLQQREAVELQRQQREAVALQRQRVAAALQQREAVELQRQQREAVALQRQQREEVALQQQRQQEEERQRQEVEIEQMRWQKETLQALIDTDAQPAPEAAGEMLVSEDINQTRLKLLVSLLRAIEESNGGTLSHLEEPQKKDGSPPQPPSNSGETASSISWSNFKIFHEDLISQSDVPAGPALASVLPSGLFPPPRAAKPPVSRVRLGVMEMMTEQHELSAIQEVETPVNTSQVTGPEDTVTVPSHTLAWAQQEDSESSVASDRTPQTPSWSSSEQRTAERSTGSETRSGTSSPLVWRERLLMGAETSPESLESDSALRRISVLSSDSGRGADDYSGPAVTSYRSPTESAHRTPDSDCPSSTTVSTGSYITTDPEQNVNTDNSSPLRRGACLLEVSSSSGQSICIEDSSAAGRPGLAVDSLFNNSSIQNIIDRYTRELNISLSTAGKTTDSEGSYVEEPGSSVSQQSLAQVSERRGEDESSTARRSLSSDTAEAQRSGLDRANAVNPILEHFSGEDPSLAEDSFRPLIGQHTDQSSCLAAEQRDSTMERLVGQPSAHSSMIGQLPGPAVSVSFDQGGWDSTLSRMIGRLSHQSSSHWLSGGQDFYAGQLMGQVPSDQSATWLDGGPEESRMRPLVGELDESAGQHSGSSGERTHVDLGVSTDASVPSYPAFPPEASSHRVSVQGVSPHPRDQTSPVDLDTERTEVFPGSDSFHPLLAEVTHNETADPSTIFHLPGHDEPASPAGERSVSTTNTDPSVDSEPSPERIRADESSNCVAAFPSLHESFSQLITSQCRPHESVLVVSPTTRTDVELTALSLSNLTMCDETPTVGMPQPEGAADRNISDMILEAASEKGILEQSEITLVSLADTTMEDQETCITEEEGLLEDKPSDGVREEGQKGRETEGSESTLSLDKTPENKNRTHPDSKMLLEFQRGPSRGLQEVHQQKRRALLERSSRRVEQIKAKGALAKIQPEIRALSEAREPSKATQPQPATCKTKSEPQHKTIAKSKEGQAEPHLTTEKSGFIKLKKPQLPSPVSDSRLNQVDEVKSCTPEQRKQDVSKMHQRTQRLYEQLEEVKHQKAIRNKQEAYAKNRLKAREFHKKTLQKLRAKQTL